MGVPSSSDRASARARSTIRPATSEKGPHPQISSQHSVRPEDVAFGTNDVIRLARIHPQCAFVAENAGFVWHCLHRVMPVFDARTTRA